jgi:hypothetical protein
LTLKALVCDLRVIPAAFDVRQEHFKLTMPSQPITAYEGDMKRFVSIDQFRPLEVR